MKKCKVDGCENKYYGVGYCGRHYQQIQKSGVLSTRTKYDKNEIIDCGDYIELCLYSGRSEQFEVARTKIDKNDLEKVRPYKWRLINGYVKKHRGDNIQTFLHRLIMGKPSTGCVVDHINTDKLDNRKKNLRFVTHAQNKMNKKVRGYSWHKNRDKWQARIRLNNKVIHLGYFINEQDAIDARRNAEQKYFKEFAYNFTELVL